MSTQEHNGQAVTIDANTPEGALSLLTALAGEAELNMRMGDARRLAILTLETFIATHSTPAAVAEESEADEPAHA